MKSLKKLRASLCRIFHRKHHQHISHIDGMNHHRCAKCGREWSVATDSEVQFWAALNIPDYGPAPTAPAKELQPSRPVDNTDQLERLREQL